jgi:hypothetical protein
LILPAYCGGGSGKDVQTDILTDYSDASDQADAVVDAVDQAEPDFMETAGDISDISDSFDSWEAVVPSFCTNTPGSTSVLYSIKGVNDEEFLPYPNVYYTADDLKSPTKIRMNVKANAFANDVNVFDGFSTYAPLLIQFSDQIDMSNLPSDYEKPASGDPIFLIRTDYEFPEKPDKDLFGKIAVSVKYQFNELEDMLYIIPEKPLKPGSWYALVVTSCLVDKKGDGIAPSSDFVEIRDGNPDIEGADRVKLYMKKVFDILERPDISLDKSHVSLVLPFVTRTSTVNMFKIREKIEKSPAPEGKIIFAAKATDESGKLNPEFLANYKGLDELLNDKLDPESYTFEHLGIIALGTFKSKKFIGENGYYNINPETGEIDPASEEELKFLLTLPKGDGKFKEPFDVIIFQHAMGVCKETVVGIANILSEYGFATIGIDAVGHGHRSPGGEWSCEVDINQFLDPLHPNLMNEKFLTTITDMMQVVKMVKNLKLDIYPLPDGNSVRDINTDRLTAISQSMGAVMEGVFLGVEPEIKAGLINVGPASLGLFFGSSIIKENPGVDFNYPKWSDVSLMFMTFLLPIQLMVEDSDPANYASFYINEPHSFSFGDAKPKNILLQEAYQDDVVPNYCMEILARIAGLSKVKPFKDTFEKIPVLESPVKGNHESGVTAAFTQFDPVNHEFLLLCKTKDKDKDCMWRGQVQTAIFLRSSIESGAGVAVNPYDKDQVKVYEDLILK